MLPPIPAETLYELVLDEDALPQTPPPARSSPRSPSKRIESPRGDVFYPQVSPSPSPSRGPGIRGPRPLESRHKTLPREPTSPSPSPTQRPGPSPRPQARYYEAYTAPPRAQSYHSTDSTSSYDQWALKLKALDEWYPAKAKGCLEYFKPQNIKSYFEDWKEWPLKKKLLVFGSIAGLILILIIIIAASTSGSSPSGDTSSLSSVHVTNSEAFDSGGASKESVTDTHDGAQGKDKYTYYSGTADKFPSNSHWVSFEDLWTRNQPTIKHSCSSLGYGPDDSADDIQIIYEAVQDTAKASLVDHRFILATILQESNGCLSAGSTTSSGGVTNPGLMQSHNGSSFVPSRAKSSIYKMVKDGTQGTTYGAGLVQNLNKYGNVYKAARGYNSGSIAPSGDLSDANGATACYVSDIANRLTGWVKAPSTCYGY